MSSYSDKHFDFGKDLYECGCHIATAKTYFGWQCVTFYYAAIHFAVCVLYHMPLEARYGGEDQDFKSFEHHYRVYRDKVNARIGQHQFRCELLSDLHHTISSDFQKLRGLCDSTRYTAIDLSDAEAAKAKDWAKSIMEYAEAETRS